MRTERLALSSGAYISINTTFHIDGVNFALPSPIASSATAALVERPPDDASRLELARDATIHFILNHRIFNVLTVVFIVGVAGFVIFLLMLFPMQMEIIPWGSITGNTTIGSAEARRE